MADNRVVYGVIGALAATTAAGAAAGGFLLQRRRRVVRNPGRFEGLDPDRSRTVQSEDGVALHVEEVGPMDAALTIVFAHGWTLSMKSFFFQRRALSEHFGADVRMVFYDQRGHGRSGPSVPDGSTIDQLGRDLYTVIDAMVPTGPMVLVGHSMGGMTVLSLAEQYPQLFVRAPRRRGAPARVRAVALISTSSGGLAGISLGLPALIARLRVPLAPLLLASARRQAALVERGRRLGTDLAWIITRRFSFGSKKVAPDVVDYLNEMIAATRIETIADFYQALMTFDLSAAMPTLASTDVLLIGAENDVMTPIEHSVVIADALPKARFIRLADTGHVSLLETPDEVNEPLIELVGEALSR
jgi:pimeloyl-ACP methyl ester carboxylesterase